MAQLLNFSVRDASTIRDSILRVIRNGLVSRGYASPNVTPGSDWFVLAQAVANELAVVEANAVVKADELMPDSATGTGLARIAAIFGLRAQPAVGSVGSVVVTSSAPITVATGSQLTDGNGLKYQVATGGTYANGTTVAVAAVDTGRLTNHLAGDVLRWVSTPPFADEKTTVATGGLTGGADIENDEALRGRLYAYLQTPPRSGNWEHVAQLAETSSSSVQKAFVYPAIQGPATLHAAVTGAPTATSKNRDVAATTVSSIVAPFVQGQLPEHVYSVITTVANVNADVAFAIAIPDATTASPPGPGGGWTNGSPWPAPDGAASFRCTVTSVATTTQFTVDAQTSPTVGVSRISWLSPIDWTLYGGLVTAVSGTAGAYVITVDQPFLGILNGAYIWPEAQNGLAYCTAVLAQFALMGPGEKTTNASALLRGFRHPRTGLSWPSTLGATLTGALTKAQSEVAAAQFFYRTDGTTTVTGSAGQVVPQVPVSLSAAPNIFVPRHIAFYRTP